MTDDVELSTIYFTYPPITMTIDVPIAGVAGWTNTTGYALKIRAADIWIGAWYGARADIQMVLRRTSDQLLLATFQWDHYQEPVGSSGTRHFLFPGYFLISQGDGLQLALNATAFGVDTSLVPAATTSPPPQVAGTATVWYSIG
jgi:hypothetical protein